MLVVPDKKATAISVPAREQGVPHNKFAQIQDTSAISFDVHAAVCSCLFCVNKGHGYLKTERTVMAGKKSMWSCFTCESEIDFNAALGILGEDEVRCFRMGERGVPPNPLVCHFDF
jgi:hypothetical protein